MANPYENALIVSTPHMRGDRVVKAQKLLAGHNAFHDNPSPIDVYPGRIDGEYGPNTASATKRAKFWLGYEDKDLDGAFGALVFNLLHGDTKLSAEFAARRKKRLEQKASPSAIKKKALELAKKELNTKESPYGSNRQKYGEWYGMNGVPWCAIFVSWCISHAGHPWKYSYVPAMVADARANKNGMSLTFKPEPGDVIAYTFGGHVDCHTAFFDSWVNEAHHDFYDLGGNTGPSDFSNGGGVARQVRNVGLVSHFIRITL